MAVAFTRAGGQLYMPIKLLLFRDSHLQVIAVGLEVANAILPSPFCADPMLPLVATLAIFKATLDSPLVVPKDKVQVTEAGNYLAERLATIAVLMDKSMPIAAALFNAISQGEGGRQRGLGKTLLFDITHGFAQRLPRTKLVKLDGDVHPYLATLMVATLVWVGETLVIPEGTQITTMMGEVFDNMLLKKAGYNYNN